MQKKYSKVKEFVVRSSTDFKEYVGDSIRIYNKNTGNIGVFVLVDLVDNSLILRDVTGTNYSSLHEILFRSHDFTLLAEIKTKKELEGSLHTYYYKYMLSCKSVLEFGWFTKRPASRSRLYKCITINELYEMGFVTDGDKSYELE